MTTPRLRKSISRSPSRLALLLIPLAFACFGLSPTVRAADGDLLNANTAEGAGALQSLTTGHNNTALGTQALFSLTTGKQNTATGAQALKVNTADENTADGFQALTKNTTGTANMASGWRALFQNTTGHGNTADGNRALYNNTDGHGNTAVGFSALFSNTKGILNTAIGSAALFSNIGNGIPPEEQDSEGNENTAVGAAALGANTTGEANCAVGAGALVINTTGDSNTAVGVGALGDNATGRENTAVGIEALANCVNGTFNIALGDTAGDELRSGDNNIYIGNSGAATESHTIRIGDPIDTERTFIAGISGVNEGGTISALYINTGGQLGTQPPPSSRRFKKEIKPMDKVSEAILALKPVTFQYKSDNKNVPQFGLIAEDVAEVNPDLVMRDDTGEIYSVRYEQVNAMLLNEFLKEHQKVEDLRKNFQATVSRQQKQIEALTAGLQKVSAQLELNKPAPQIVADNQ
jgi:hypothetical protein